MTKDEYNIIIAPYLQNTNVQKMKNIKHHFTNRLSHCIKVSYFSFLICKMIDLNYKEAARAALLHDFYFDKIKNKKGVKEKIYEFSNGHPQKAYINTVKNFNLTPLEENIILSHMWPISKFKPKYKEAIVVGIIDKIMTLIGH